MKDRSHDDRPRFIVTLNLSIFIRLSIARGGPDVLVQSLVGQRIVLHALCILLVNQVQVVRLGYSGRFICSHCCCCLCLGYNSTRS